MSSPATMPVFPLGSVFFPLMQVPLRIFEERYRIMVANLLAKPPKDRVFVLVGIREGYEVGTSELPVIYDVGCEVLLTKAEGDVADGYEIECTVTHRVKITSLDASADLLIGDVERLPEEPYSASPQNAHLAARVLASLDTFIKTLSQTTQMTLSNREFPADPEALSYTLAGHLPLLAVQQQRLLESANTGVRLQLLHEYLETETIAMRVVPSLPAHDLIRVGWSPN